MRAFPTADHARRRFCAVGLTAQSDSLPAAASSTNLGPCGQAALPTAEISGCGPLRFRGLGRRSAARPEFIPSPKTIRWLMIFQGSEDLRGDGKPSEIGLTLTDYSVFGNVPHPRIATKPASVAARVSADLRRRRHDFGFTVTHNPATQLTGKRLSASGLFVSDISFALVAARFSGCSCPSDSSEVYFQRCWHSEIARQQVMRRTGVNAARNPIRLRILPPTPHWVSG